MPFDICNKENKHIGIIAEYITNNGFFDGYLVAITDLKMKDMNFDFDKMKGYLMGRLECKNILGKGNEKKFKEAIKSLADQEATRRPQGLCEEDYIKILFLKYFAEKNFRSYYNDEILTDKIKGYILLDRYSLEIKEGTIMIDVDIKKENDLIKVGELYPVYGKIVRHPIVSGISNPIGSHHYHRTRIEFKSGNCITELEVYIYINCKKNDELYLYWDNNKLKYVFTGGMIYEF